MSKNKCILLGTGTSQGIPVIGCACEVCNSKNALNFRLRSSIYLDLNGTSIVIDTGPDFRQQMLKNKVRHLDAILITHEHNDHIAGLDDIRPFNFMQKKDMLLYSTPRVSKELRKRFDYVFSSNKYPGAPSVEIVPIDKEAFKINGNSIQPIHYMHGNVPVLGFRIGDLAYLTDIKTINEEELRKLKHLKTLIVSALHHEEHHSHLNLTQALELIKVINPEIAYLTHISHRMGLSEVISMQLPEGIQFAYDGLTIDINL